MNLQEFACAISDLIWGGELGWDREGGLRNLFNAVKGRIAPATEANSRAVPGYVGKLLEAGELLSRVEKILGAYGEKGNSARERQALEDSEVIFGMMLRYKK